MTTPPPPTRMRNGAAELVALPRQLPAVKQAKSHRPHPLMGCGRSLCTDCTPNNYRPLSSVLSRPLYGRLYTCEQSEVLGQTTIL